MINAEAVAVLDTQEGDVTPLGVQGAFSKKQHLRGELRVTSPPWVAGPLFPASDGHGQPPGPPPARCGFL